MYHQINSSEMFRERQLALLEEAGSRRLARRAAAGGAINKARSARVAASGFLAAVVVAGIMLMGLGSPAHASETYSVTLPSDTPERDLEDDRCDVSEFFTGDQCTLRAAIQQANATDGADTIVFAISGSGPHTISPISESLPTITERVTIDGYTQPGSTKNTLSQGTNAQPMIELYGDNAGSSGRGLTVQASGTVIRGLVINGFDLEGILVSGASAVRVEGNFIGTDPSGTIDFGNGQNGVLLYGASSTTVGGSTPEARNLISGNAGEGVAVAFEPSANNRVQGNLIGTKKDGTSALGNSHGGVRISASGRNLIGGATPAEANTIAFNALRGVVVLFEDSTSNRIISNSIYSNGGVGIDLAPDSIADGPTPNDPKDLDTGANTLQNYPVITSAITSDGKTTIRGTLNSRPNKTYKLQFFSIPSGQDEGKKFLGQKKVETSRKGIASITFSSSEALAVGQAITATATGPGGNTSEFSVARSVSAS